MIKQFERKHSRVVARSIKCMEIFDFIWLILSIVLLVLICSQMISYEQIQILFSVLLGTYIIYKIIKSKVYKNVQQTFFYGIKVMDDSFTIIEANKQITFNRYFRMYCYPEKDEIIINDEKCIVQYHYDKRLEKFLGEIQKV